MSDTLFRVDTSAFTKLSQKYFRLVGELDSQVDISLNKIAETSERAFANAARGHGYARVAEGVRAIKAGSSVVIEVEAIDPESGYDYAPVTRFGHRVKYIYPRNSKYLRFPYHGKILYRRRVKAWSPTVDWASQAIPEVRSAVRGEARNLGRRLARRAS